ncbi:hypothetical protein ACCO45_000868 [Purpureocillium lilacinum]|uniref:Uncharacterized protein n=1 Tax=Purpureocillium lilacinum TaxID=33203 RepID=A0ACC4E6U3_PURLI
MSSFHGSQTKHHQTRLLAQLHRGTCQDTTVLEEEVDRTQHAGRSGCLAPVSQSRDRGVSEASLVTESCEPCDDRSATQSASHAHWSLVLTGPRTQASLVPCVPSHAVAPIWQAALAAQELG